MTTDSAPSTPLPYPYRAEEEIVGELTELLTPVLDWRAVAARAAPWVTAVRAHPAPFWALDSLLHEYPISSAEGLSLMRLAEALLRIPDVPTAIALTADQLNTADFDAAPDSAHPFIARLSNNAIALAKGLLPDVQRRGSVLQRLGGRTVVAAAVRAVQLLGKQFVLGQSIADGIAEARRTRAVSGNDDAASRTSKLRFSFDMLGEGARCDADAQRYLTAYANAIAAIGAANRAHAPEHADGISIKLSALHPRYEEAQRERVFAELLPRLWRLVDAAARANINLTIDAEESDRLALSLDVFADVAAKVAHEHIEWQGLGLAVQAYQTRSVAVIEAVAAIARKHQLRCMVRLVKGAYWDSEIKRAQEMGLPAYPVFTRKPHTDMSYLVCAHTLLRHSDVLYAQFATHNASTIAAVTLLAQQIAPNVEFEMQRLHGMGEAVYREVRASRPIHLRIYAPIGAHRDLLAYLVRRLLENGANSSFVHQLSDNAVDIDALLASPWHALLSTPHTANFPAPRVISGSQRISALGVDLACAADRLPLLAQISATKLVPTAFANQHEVPVVMARLAAQFTTWRAVPLAERCALLRSAANTLEARCAEFTALLVREARKTLPDSVAEVREAIDFCRYYADQADATLAPRPLQGPTGESNELRLRGRGVFVCISPWNFPLAIFTGQVVAALVAGNCVAAKPAEQTPLIAARMVALLHDAGIPDDALAMLHGPGDTVGAALVADPRCAGVCFTGSFTVAKTINLMLAGKPGPIVPLIAETGGINAMIVDSSALPEQVVDAVVQSAFRSSGQRCSALRLLCVHESIADNVLSMLAGAMTELQCADPALLRTDVGPIIDDAAAAELRKYIADMRAKARVIGQTLVPTQVTQEQPCLVAPIAFEVASIASVTAEIFGPVLHVTRWQGDDVNALIDEINALGYGLTLGIQTRIDSRAQAIADTAQVGNVYVNRNMIGAVVGVQPFGGEQRSGTGPKAGGPHYLLRFCLEQTVTINTTAAGGNASLLAGTLAGPPTQMPAETSSEVLSELP